MVNSRSKIFLLSTIAVLLLSTATAQTVNCFIVSTPASSFSLDKWDFANTNASSGTYAMANYQNSGNYTFSLRWSSVVLSTASLFYFKVQSADNYGRLIQIDMTNTSHNTINYFNLDENGAPESVGAIATNATSVQIIQDNGIVSVYADGIKVRQETSTIKLGNFSYACTNADPNTGGAFSGRFYLTVVGSASAISTTFNTTELLSTVITIAVIGIVISTIGAIKIKKR